MSQRRSNQIRSDWELHAYRPPDGTDWVGQCVVDAKDRRGRAGEVAREFAVDLAEERGLAHKEAWKGWRIEVYHPSDLVTPVMKASVNLLLPKDRESVLLPMDRDPVTSARAGLER